MAKRISESTRASILQAITPYRREDGSYPVPALEEIGRLFEVSRRSILRMANETRLDSCKPRTELNHELIVATYFQFSGRAKPTWKKLKADGIYTASYRSFLRYLDRLDPALRAAARAGAKGLQAESIYLKADALHRNERWHLDHTQLDILVVPDRGSYPVRPWMTNLTDRKTGCVMAADIYIGAPNAERVIATLARGIIGDRTPNGEQALGGIPNTLVFDNALEHFSEALIKGCMSLGITATPTTPYHSWQNGQVERIHRSLVEELLVQLPGYIHAGETDDGKRRFAPETTEHPSPVNLLPLEVFRARVEQWRQDRNQTHETNSGFTPRELWDMDSTAIRTVSNESILRAMLLDGGKRSVQKAGIRFRNRDYLCPEMADYRRKSLTVRYLPTVTDWIELFDGDTYVGRATDAIHLSEQERRAILNNRRAVKKEVNKYGRLARDQHNQSTQTAVELFDSEKALPENPGAAQNLINGALEQRQPRIRKTSGNPTRKYRGSTPTDSLSSIAKLDLSALVPEVTNDDNN